MATTPTNSLSLPSSSTLRQPPSASTVPQCFSLPTLPPPPVQSQSRVARTTACCRKVTRNVVAMATGEAPPEIVTAGIELETTSTDILQKVQEAWDKVEDKYAVSSLAVAGVIALCASTGMISAIDRLPLIPGALELVGIGYTGWFAYQNIVFKPDREAFLQKIKDTYKEIIGSS